MNHKGSTMYTSRQEVQQGFKYIKKLLTNTHFNTWLTLLDVKLDKELEKIQARAWTAENFKFATAVSVMASSKIEGETMETEERQGCLKNGF